MSLSFPRSAQFSWGRSPEPRRTPSPGWLCSQQDPVRPTRASAAGQGSRPTKLSDIAHEGVRYVALLLLLAHTLVQAKPRYSRALASYQPPDVTLIDAAGAPVSLASALDYNGPV